MVNTGELESYLNERTTREGDIWQIITEGEIVEIKDRVSGKVKKALNISVESGNRKLTYTPGKNATKEMQKKWGMDTKDWVGKKFQIKLVLMQIGANEQNVIKPVPLDI